MSETAELAKIEEEVLPYASVFLDNISVDGINLSGMTWEQGSAAVWKQANEKQSGWYVRLRTETGAFNDITAETLGISFDPSRALQEAWAIGHDSTKTVFEQKEIIDYMKANTRTFSSAKESGSTAPIDSILETLERNVYRAPQNAEITAFNKDDSTNPFTFKQEQNGQYLDTTEIKEQILSMVQNFESGVVELRPQPLVPEVTVADLQKKVTIRFQAITPIDKHSTDNRNHNIALAFSKFHGIRITNGSTFSFNDKVGKRTEKNGFLPANEYVYGDLVEGIGGGVCQASTTLYLAAIQSGMTILRRKPHSVPVNYTKLGMDATVSDTKGREVDFSFRNESGGDIFITAQVLPDGANKNRLNCVVRIYGLSLESTRYELRSVEVEVIPKPTREEADYRQDKDAKYVVFAGEEYIAREASEGFVVDTYLYTIVDGAVAAGDDKPLYRDTYPARNEIIYVGVTPRWDGS